MTMPADPMSAPLAQQGQVAVGPGDVNRVCPGCQTGTPAGNDGDPRHVVVGGRQSMQQAVLPSGQSVPVLVPEDVAYHFDCHAAAGCDHCREMVDAHDGSVKGKADALSVPDHLLSLEPGEFDSGSEGVLVRRATKAEARRAREGAAKKEGFAVVPHDEADQLHAAHAAKTTK